jgi:putative transposase
VLVFPVSVEPARLDILLQKRRDKAAARRFFKRVLAACAEVPRKIVTDQLRSYPAAKAEIPELAHVKHVFVKASARLNNRAENSHQPTRERERRMRGFRVPERTEAFLSSFGPAALRAQATSAVRFALSQATRRALCLLASLH